MKAFMNYIMNNRLRTIVFLALCVVIFAVVFNACTESFQDNGMVTVWVMCKPGDYINVRQTPSTKAMVVGRLDPCDSFQTDGVSSNGFIRCYGIGEYGEGWIYSGYV